MKNGLYNFLISLSLFLLLVALFLGWGVFRKDQLDNASQQLAITTLQIIFSAENAQFLVDNAHPDYLLEMSEESLNKYIASTRCILGPLNAITAIRGASGVSLNPLGRGSTSSNYEVDLTFADGQVTALVSMIYQQRKWQFTDFVLESELLVD